MKYGSLLPLVFSSFPSASAHKFCSLSSHFNRSFQETILILHFPFALIIRTHPLLLLFSSQPLSPLFIHVHRHGYREDERLDPGRPDNRLRQALARLLPPEAVQSVRARHTTARLQRERDRRLSAACQRREMTARLLRAIRLTPHHIPVRRGGQHHGCRAERLNVIWRFIPYIHYKCIVKIYSSDAVSVSFVVIIW